jgi:hypothetical protein
LPIAVDNQTAAQWLPGHTYTLNRKDPGSNKWPDAAGNWGTVSLCGTSGNSIRDTIADGFYGPITIGQTLTTQTGVDGGNIKNGFQDRMTGTDSPSGFVPTDKRAVIVPLVDFSNSSGQCDVTVTGFMAFYLDSWNNGNAGNGSVSGTFVKMVTGNSSADATVTGDAGVQADPILTN